MGENGLHVITDSSMVFICTSESDGMINEKATVELGGQDRGPAQAHFGGVQTAHPERGQAGHFPPALV